MHSQYLLHTWVLWVFPAGRRVFFGQTQLSPRGSGNKPLCKMMEGLEKVIFLQLCHSTCCFCSVFFSVCRSKSGHNCQTHRQFVSVFPCSPPAPKKQKKRSMNVLKSWQFNCHLCLTHFHSIYRLFIATFREHFSWDFLRYFFFVVLFSGIMGLPHIEFCLGFSFVMAGKFHSFGIIRVSQRSLTLIRAPARLIYICDPTRISLTEFPISMATN